jgi:hypothetical protein
MAAIETDNNKQIDTDILQCKADILRASDIIPSSRKKVFQELKPQQAAQNTSYPANATENPAVASQEQAEIPKFDLAEEIMAEQRKITAIRRKRPGKKNEVQNQDIEVKPTGYATKQPTQKPSQQKQIIVEIVARDIEKLCRYV